MSGRQQRVLVQPIVRKYSRQIAHDRAHMLFISSPERNF